ncbi:hypothetical protein N792_09465 [Lysobacter concretionis Ko07 = DSM 16239]|uniref:Uncharacterized protein n=1 Tax=Lysobacter concretionis Ko07 = DSM 16239 TaxID=1122185 RepID=A0A0A0EP34_9GAMM|nr:MULTISPECIES: hypothetical protein [Lysobacter]KGM51853.1 hypothetical protein N792_09465 [Lysobacter concretionis Ko07 = DSM 16239]QOD92071.1 hypothetical protein H2514_05450 [Lysobacter sp. CW239]
MARLVDQIEKQGSSQKTASRPTGRKPDALLVRDGGLPYTPSGDGDPFEAWAELMEVVEALSPRWPARPRSSNEASFRL